MFKVLTEPSTLDYNAIEFNQVDNDQFLPAAKESIAQAKSEIETIKNSTDHPTFENTILALESCSESFDQVAAIFFNLFSCHADDKIQALAKDMSQLSSAFSSDLLLDEKLFQKVKVVFDSMDSSNYNPEQKRLIEKTYKGFVRNGALLSAEQKEKIRSIDQEMSQLTPQFSENVLKDTNAFEYHVTDQEKLAGLPDSSIQAAKKTAEEKKKSGWVFTLQAPSYIPFMTYSEDRSAREMIWKAANSGACQGETNNQDILKKIALLRHQRAQVLGYKTHADFVLSERMAESPEKVYQFLNQLIDASSTAAKKDVEEVQAFRTEMGSHEDIMPWDYSFYAEKLKEKKYQFSQEEIRPYFQLENVVEGAFTHAKKLYNLSFKKRSDLPIYHKDVDVFEVSHQDTGDFVGLFYTDFFPRSTKKNGAWMTNYRDQGLRQGELHRPHVSIVCNFTKPTDQQPSLLTLDEVRTLFHEFGHALHSLLSQCTYPSLSGTHVYWDFVELPSQINENWVLEKETLQDFAKHYQTGEVLPDAMIEKIKAASQFQAGYFSLRQLNFALLDMEWHSKDPSSVGDVAEFEKKATEKTSVLPRIEGTMTSPRFSHIFAGGYSSGYYSYKWAEVLDADAFELFKEKGLYDPETAKKFRENILERGGTEHPMSLYKKFRGREPDPNALLRRDGLI